MLNEIHVELRVKLSSVAQPLAAPFARFFAFGKLEKVYLFDTA
jgi:hypothetical protein